ncbi:hypothetical protein GH714_026636 [Hevea brasiliensis]|uniref:IST1-like protein n=1 Tax=Hevea brasiliensis TaxID=3981 RepID=A0A6A6LU66_HEVBR|nr:hypothetical protein GH714_026636 [Hevea brasiliensis]
MLHKSFKPAKCKTALKLAASRIKLLKNKREAQLKQLKRELAQLLETGQDQTARIRVEHVVREEKTMAAYDLIEIYCELIVAPFTSKYGKNSSLQQLNYVQTVVSRLLVEKLSAKAPDGPTKMKILSAIAEEHNVKWDPKSFGEKDIMPHEDLLAMPTGTSHLDPRTIGTGCEEMEFRHSYAAEQSGFSVGRQSWNMEFKDATAAAQAAAESAERASMAARAAAELSSQGRITRQHLREKESVFRSRDEGLQTYAGSRVEGEYLAKDPVNKTPHKRITRQHSTETKKASVFRSRDEGIQTYAASRVQGEHLANDPVNNTTHRSNSGMNHEQSFENEQDDMAGLAERFNNLKSTNRPSQLASSKSSSSSVNDYPLVNDFQMADSHYRKNLSELEKSDLVGEANIKGESSESEVELVSEVHDEMRSENVGYFEATSNREQSSSVSSHSHSQISRDDHNVFSSFSHQKFSEEAAKEPYIFYEGNFQRNTKETNPFDNASVVFDDSGSDDDGLKLDDKGEYNGQDSGSYYLSEGRKSSSHLLANTSADSPRLNMEESLGKSSSQSPFASGWHATSVFSEGLTSDTVSSQVDESLPVTFDESDGPSSESEGELNKSKLVESTHTGSFPHKDIACSGNPETTQNERHHFIGSSLAEKENVGSNRKNQGNEVGAETDRTFSYGYLHTNPISHRLAKSQTKSNDNPKTSGFSSVKDDIQSYQSVYNLEDTISIKESSLESGKELNFAILTGGLRNKGYRHPPYRRNPSDNSSVSKQAERIIIPVHPKINKNSSLGTPVPHSDASDDESDEELAKQTQEPYIHKAAPEVNKKSGLRSYFDLDNSDSEEELPNQTVTKTRPGPGLSRRTKQTVTSNTLSISERNPYLKSRLPSDSSITPEYAMEMEHNSSSSSSYTIEAQVMPTSLEKSSDYWGSSEQGRSTGQIFSKPISQSKMALHNWGSSEQRRSAEPSKPIMESKRYSQEENLKTSAWEQRSNPPLRTVSSGAAESTKASCSKDDTLSRENSINKASHVHPKLPDYDALTAHLLSLRQHRQ